MKGEEGIAMAMETLVRISKDENERARLLTQEKNLLDWQSGINYARKEGYKEAAAQYQSQLSAQQSQLSAQQARIAELERQLAESRR
jgi:hypothetical protein